MIANFCKMVPWMTPAMWPTHIILCSVRPDSSSNPLPSSLNNICTNYFHVQERKDRKQVVMMMWQTRKVGERLRRNTGVEGWRLRRNYFLWEKHVHVLKSHDLVTGYILCKKWLEFLLYIQHALHQLLNNCECYNVLAMCSTFHESFIPCRAVRSWGSLRYSPLSPLPQDFHHQPPFSIEAQFRLDLSLSLQTNHLILKCSLHICRLADGTFISLMRSWRAELKWVMKITVPRKICVEFFDGFYHHKKVHAL